MDLAGLVLLGHSSLDRVMGYGLKFDISFCHPDGSGYCSRVINPGKQVEIHLALLGQLPSRSITLAELQNLQVPSTAVLVPGAFYRPFTWPWCDQRRPQFPKPIMVNHFDFLREDLTLMILVRTYKLMKS